MRNRETEMMGERKTLGKLERKRVKNRETERLRGRE